MNILLLEDDASIAEALELLLEDVGHSVFYAYDIDDAQDIIEFQKIDFIITDLNMAGEGLDEGEYKNTLEGTLSGYIWLKNYALMIKPELRSRTIIFSAYTKELKDQFDADELSSFKIISKDVTIEKKVENILSLLK